MFIPDFDISPDDILLLWNWTNCFIW